MNFEQIVLETIDTFLGLNVETKLRPSTIPKIEIADIYINGEKKGMLGSRDGFKNDVGCSLGRNIPGIGNDTKEQGRQDLVNFIIKKTRKERDLQRVMKHGASEEEAKTILKI
jgi:hypothetical protein